MVITLGPELAKAVSDAAQRQGVGPETLALQVLRERFLGPPPLDEPRDDWERRLRQLATNCGAPLPDSALSSEGLYD